MVLINNLTIDEINAAFIALQRSRTEIVGGEKGNTVNNISITNKGGGNGTDWSTVIQTIQSRLSQMQTVNDRQDEEITDIRSILEGLAETVGQLADNGVSGINFDENSRRLTIFTQDGNSYDTLIPTERVRLEFDENTNTLTLYMGNQRAVVTLPSMTQVQADWEQSDPTAVDYIKNKIPIWIADGSADDNMTPIDSVTDGNMRPVTSNAVFDHSPRGSAYCSTGASTAAKVASMQDYVLQNGATFLITFKNSNSAASALTLQINDTAAKALYINGSASSADNYTLNAGTYICRYNGTNYYIDRSYAVPNARSSNTATTSNRSYSLDVAVTCSTAADTAAKTVSLSGFSLVSGARLIVNVSNTNTATGPLTLSVNSTTAKTIKVNGRVTSSSFNTLASGYYNCYYDGTYWCMTDVKSEVTNSVSASNTIAYCSTGASIVAKTATLYGYALRSGDRILLYMANTNTASTPTLNVNSTGAKAIRINGSTAVSATYKALPKGLYMAHYDGTYWNLYNLINLYSGTSFNGSASAVTLDTAYGALGVRAWYLSETAGYIVFTNDFKIQYARQTTSTANCVTKNFPIAFTNIPVCFCASNDGGTNMSYTWTPSAGFVTLSVSNTQYRVNRNSDACTNWMMVAFGV